MPIPALPPINASGTIKNDISLTTGARAELPPPPLPPSPAQVQGGFSTWAPLAAAIVALLAALGLAVAGLRTGSKKS